MQNVIMIGRRHVPREHIAYVEPFELAEDSDFKPEKPFRARVVLLDRESVLSEATPNEFAEAHGFRMFSDDNVATNPAIKFRVESFEPTEGFTPGKPYLTRLMWRDASGKNQSKLLLTKPEAVLAAVLRSDSESNADPKERPHRPQRSDASPLRLVETPEA